MPGMKFICEGLTPEIVKRAEKELGETEEIKTKTLRELKNLIKKESDFHPCTDDAFLLRFLRVKKFQTNRAFELLQKYYRFKARYSGSVTDLKPSDIKPILKLGQAIVLENRDQNDVGVCLFRLGQYDITQFPADYLLAAGIIFFEVGLLVETSQVVGGILLIDLDNFGWRMIKHYASPTLMYKVIYTIQECIPARIRAIHIVNEPFHINVLLKVLSMFMSEKLQKRIQFHGKNLSSLHKSIPPEILPEEYGGTQGPMSELAKTFAAYILRHEDHFIKLNEYGYVGNTLKKLRQ